MNDPETCDECGRPLDEHDRDFRFLLPDSLSDLTDEELEQRVSGDDTFLRVDESQFFIRAIIPIQLTGAHLVAYAVWLAAEQQTLIDAYRVWDQPEYAGLVIKGTVANTLPPWPQSSYGAEIIAEVRHLSELPYAVRSSNAEFQIILERAWDHDTVLRTFGETE